MNRVTRELKHETDKDAIDAYFQCITYCSIDDQENDCKTICMERHLKANYF